jgi:protocatechuate 3,4-dioxygenase beta subunit
MPKQRKLLLLAGCLMLTLFALASVWLSSQAGDSPDELPAAGAEQEDGVLAGDAIAAAGKSDEADRRVAVEAGASDDADGEQAGSSVELAISGRVVDAGGAPIADARVGAFVRRGFGPPGGFQQGRDRQRRSGIRNLEEETTDREGRFRLVAAAFEDTAVSLAVRHPSFATRILHESWRAGEGELRVGDIVVEPGAVVAGRAVDEFGRPVAGAEVRYLLARGGGPGGRRGGGRAIEWMLGDDGDDEAVARLVPVARTDASGAFTLERVPEGRVRVRVEAPRRIPAESPQLDVKAGGRFDAGVLQLSLGATLSGRVLDRHGAPISGAQVEATAADAPGGPPELGTPGPARRSEEAARAVGEFARAMGERGERRGRRERSVRTGEDGRFALDALPLGPLSLRVSHNRFLSAVVEPIEPARQPEIDVRLSPALAVEGIVVDGQGEPIELFGVAARRSDDRGRRGPPGGREATPPRPTEGGGDGRRGRGGDASPEEQAAFEAMRAEWTNSARRRDDYVRQRVGGAGVMPGRTPDPTAHAGGRFVLERLQPGEHLIDVFAPGYAPLTIGPVKLEADVVPSPVRVALQRGMTISGTVVAQAEGAPVEGARVQLLLPDLEEPAPTAALPVPMGRFAAAGRRGMTNLSLETVTTDAGGKFVFKPRLDGQYWIRVEANGFDTLLDKSIALRGGRDRTGLELKLRQGAELFGTVLNSKPDQRLALNAWSLTGRRYSAVVDPTTGEYRLPGMESGSYFVALAPRGDMGAMVSQLVGAFADPSTARPDVVLAEGQRLRYDVDAKRARAGTVTGTLAVDGLPAAGVDARLVPENSEGPAAAPTMGAGGRGGRFLGRILNARTDERGHFTIDDVPFGRYRLELQRGGGRGSPVLHRASLQVDQSTPIELAVSVATGSVELTVVDQDGDKPIPRGNVQLALGNEAAGKQPAQWRDLPSLQRLQVREGKVTGTGLPAGTYAFNVQSQGYEPGIGTVVIGGPATGVRVALKRVAPPAK